jgi:hypothetical protein
MRRTPRAIAAELLRALSRPVPATALAIVVLAIIVFPRMWNAAVDQNTLYVLTRLDAGVPAWDALRYSDDGGGSRHMIESGVMPWFVGPDTGLYWYKPFIGLSLAGLHSIFGHAPLPYWLFAFTVHAAAFLCLALLLRRLLPGPIASLACVTFVLDDVHAEALSWMGAYHSSLMMTFMILGLLAHIRWREGWRPGIWLGLICWACALLSHETALPALAFVACLELFGIPRPRKLQTLVPWIALGLGYLVWYKSAGFGPHGVPDYVDLIAEPGRFLAGVPEQLLGTFTMTMFGNHNSHKLWTYSTDIWISFGIAAVTIPIFVAFVRSTEPTTRTAIGALLLGAFVSHVPLLGYGIMGNGLPSGRKLLIFSIGGAVFWGVVLYQAICWCRQCSHLGERLVAGVAALIFAALSFVWSPTLLEMDSTNRFMHWTAARAGLQYELMHGAKVCGPGRRVVWVRNWGMPYNMYGYLGEAINAHARARHGRRIEPQVILASSWTVPVQPLWLTRTGDQQLELESTPGTPLYPSIALPPNVGELIRVSGAEIVPLATGPTGIWKIRVTFVEPYPARTCVVTMGNPDEVPLPPIGQRLEL